MKQIDYGLLKIQYEVFGESVQDLADQYDTTPRMIEYAAEEHAWQRLPIATALNEWKQLDNLVDLPPDLMDQVRDRMQILFTLKQSSLNPRYIAIEAALLGKAQSVVENLNPDHPNAAQVLKSLADVFTALREGAGLGRAAAEEDGRGKSITVNIAQRVEPTLGVGERSPTPQTVQVQVAEAPLAPRSWASNGGLVE